MPFMIVGVLSFLNWSTKNWKMNLPDFESHFDEIGYIEDGDDETELSSYEEE